MNLEDGSLLSECRFNEGRNSVIGCDIAHVDEHFHVGEQRRISLHFGKVMIVALMNT